MTNFYILLGLAVLLGVTALIIARSSDWRETFSAGLTAAAFVAFVASIVALIVQHRP